MKHLFSALLIFVAFASTASAEVKKYKFVLSAGAHDRLQTPVRVPVLLPKSLLDAPAEIIDSDGKRYPAQVTRGALLSVPRPGRDADTPVEIVFLAPPMKAGQMLTLGALVRNEGDVPPRTTKWTDTPGQFSELSFTGRPVLRYMHAALDESTKDTRSATFKPYHHVYDPSGKMLLTKGPGGLFPHHRGVFYGFNRISYADGKKADVWHCTDTALRLLRWGW